MKILMIAPQYFPLVGGYERACQRLSEALVNSGNSVTVIAERRDKNWPKYENVNNVKVCRWWCIYKDKLHLLTSMVGLVIYLIKKGRDYDVWHIHQYGFHAAVLVLISKFLSKPVVLKLTSSSEWGIENSLKQSKFSRVLMALHSKVDAVVALTEETKKEALNFGIVEERIHVLGNGVDTKIYSPSNPNEKKYLKKSLGFLGRKIVLFVGRLSEEKNIDGLMRAWKSASLSIDPSWCLVIVGQGPLEEALVRMSHALNISDSTFFMGYQDNVDQWMKASDIYISTSWFEGLSNSMLEAMATSLPVVVTRVSGVDGLISDSGAGIAVGVGDMTAIADAITLYANNEDLCMRAGILARDKIEKFYSIDVVASRHQRLYGDCIF